ncbi:glycosyltransferase family 2 protein [Flavobacterium psychrophilum]|uniref:glycosyltransferase family 2 protein n=1 Tax=Flavobacterium psychrophilum TaxID=96345 RepID=UPI00054B8832|nr:glycosyltransferase family 2 protein [Flavobacterium psychrophilum]EKT3964376.1 glycosyltransferase family 2 protein [Flavobacterium psychrophilum]EKT4509188.1 glycosyltransferase family 2 protein [Flavobacterium psychrophilum]EKT4517903.1 glycosyltransferase family 2 protein [Flavobacterium psychrophilum]MCB6061365.1 glycosyltransferase family 2 protein [Flavobacterium psychrophilum]MEB3379643.1 glycosyltransferase family 2 protein [Flavobacterium psychrophilum]
MKDKKIAVVILNWNGQKLLEQFLPSIVRHSDQATIYVADNASTDASITFVKSHFPEVKIIQNNKNFGFAKGYNQALQDVEEEIYALVNSDIEVTKNWLQPIISLFKNEPKTSIVQPKILDFKNKKYFEYAGAGGGFIDKYGFPFCRGRIFDTIEKDNAQYNDTTEIFWASGACFFIRKEIFRELNGFDVDFFAHQEEIDLCWRAFNKGYIAKYCGKSTVYHVGGATLNTENPKKTFLNFRNSLWMLAKNLPKNKLFPVLFIRMCLDAIAAIRFLTKGKFKHFWAVLESHFYLYYFLLKFLGKRNTNQSERYYKTKSIVYLYFIKNIKLFRNNF